MTVSYTPEELTTVTNAVMLSGMAVAIADIGIVSTAIEMAALAKEVVGATKRYPTNSIIQAVFSDDALKQNSVGQAPKDLTPDNAADQAIAAINNALTVLSSKAAPEEISEYKQFIYAAAEAVAKAAGEGLFGTGSTKVSDKEAATLVSIKAALGL